MGRKSPFTLPHLLRRAESGAYSYNHNVPADLRPALSGQIDCSRSRETRAVAGDTVIKLSLNTTDLGTAKQRWNQIHAQVELIVDAASQRQRSARKNRARKPLRRLMGLSDTEITALAAAGASDRGPARGRVAGSSAAD